MYFLSFFNFALSPCQGTWLQGYKGRMHSPLVPVHVPMDLQGHFLNILLSEKENILSLVLSLVRDRDISIFVPRGTGTYRILSIDLSIDLSLSLFLSLVIFWRNFLIFNCKIAIIFDPSADSFFTYLSRICRKIFDKIIYCNRIDSIID